MKLEQFKKQQFLNIESFRKNGQAVKTPVWFVQDGETLLVWTQAGSGKAKRIRRDGNIRIAPCTGSGELLGEWAPAYAKTNESVETVKHTTTLMKKKYGLFFTIFGFIGRMRGGSNYTTISIQLQNQ